jgi:hypothetical protein
MLQAVWKHALIIAFSVCVAGAGSAYSATKGSGRPSASARSALAAEVALAPINASHRFNSASFGTGAVGLRNRGDGGIEVSGVALPMKRALIYWAVITQGAPPAAVASIFLRRGSGNTAFTNIVGVKIGAGGPACWAGDRVSVYRANIPLSIATGNGLYVIRLKPGANGSTAGESPWVASDPPLFEGASIVLIGTGNSTVLVYDRGLAGKDFFGDLTYQLNSPVSVASSSAVLFHNIGADGQIGVGVRGFPATASDITFLNNRRIAGPGSPARDSDWNGGSAGPLPQLWDNTTHNVTAEAKAGSSPTALRFKISAPDDCVVPVANLLSITP